MKMALNFVVDVPIDAAYGYLSDLSLALSDLAPGYAITPTGPCAPGDVLSVAGPGLETPWRIEVVSLTPPTNITLRAYGSDRPDRYGDATYELEATGNQTRVVGAMRTNLSTRLEFGMRILQPLLMLQGRRGNRKLAAAIERRYRSGELN